MVFARGERAERAPPFILLGTQARIHVLAESSQAQGLKWRGQGGGDSSSFHLCLHPPHSSRVSTKATSSVKPSESLQNSPSLPQHSDILLMCSISFLHCITNYPQSRQLQTMHIYYLTASVDQESRHGSTGSSAQDFTRLESRYHLGYVFIWRLDFWSIHFYLIQVFGRTRFLWLWDWSHSSLLDIVWRTLSSPRSCPKFLEAAHGSLLHRLLNMAAYFIKSARRSSL